MKIDIPVEEVQRYMESLYMEAFRGRIAYVSAEVDEEQAPGVWTFKLTYAFAEAPK